MEQSQQSRPGTIEKLKSRASERWAALQVARPWVADYVKAWALFQERNGGQYAGAITFFSFLALFPLVLLAVSVIGFVLYAHPAAQATLFEKIESSLSGSAGATVQSALQSAINARASIGAVALIGVLLTGLGWIGNLRAAVNALWGTKPPQRNFILSKVANLLVLAGLGLAVLVSIGITAVGTSLTDQIVHALGWQDVGLVHWLVKVIGIGVAVAGDVLIFGWVLVRLPKVQAPLRVVVQGALMASIGYEVLKIAGTYTIAKSAHSPTAGPFASILAVLIWIELVAQLMLYCAAWMSVVATAAAGAAQPSIRPMPAPVAPEQPDQPDQPQQREQPEPITVSPAAVAGTLLGVGAAAGAAAVAWATRRHRRGRGDPVG